MVVFFLGSIFAWLLRSHSEHLWLVSFIKVPIILNLWNSILNVLHWGSKLCLVIKKSLNICESWVSSKYFIWNLWNSILNILYWAQNFAWVLKSLLHLRLVSFIKVLYMEPFEIIFKVCCAQNYVWLLKSYF